MRKLRFREEQRCLSMTPSKREMKLGLVSGV